MKRLRCGRGALLVAVLGALLLPPLAGEAGRTAPPAQDANPYVWLPLASPTVPGGQVDAIAVAPSAPDTLYALLGGFLYRSTDGADHWQQVGPLAGNPPGIPPSILVDPGNPDQLFSLTLDGALSRSLDAGVSWTQVLTATAMAAPTPARVYAAVPTTPPDPQCKYGGISFARSDDGGKTWQRTALGCIDPVTQIATASGTPDVVYIRGIAADERHASYLKRSADGGRTWEDLPMPSISLLDPLLLDPARPNHVFLAGGAVWRSTDGGRTWQKLQVPWPTELSIFLAGPGGLLYAAPHEALSQTPIYRSDDGGDTWWAGVNNLPDGITTLAADPQRARLWVGMSEYGIFRSEDGGNSWLETNGGISTPELVGALAAGGSAGSEAIFAGGLQPRGGLWGSVDRGKTWQQTLRDRPILALAADPQAPGAVYAGLQSGLYRCTLAAGCDPEYELSPIDDIAVAPSDPAFVYAASSADGDGLVVRVAGTGAPPFGALWSSSVISGTERVTGLAVDPHDPELVYAGAYYLRMGVYSESAVYRSRDGGQTWQQISPNFPLSGLLVAVDPADGQTIYAAGSGMVNGVYRSQDGGGSWQDITGGPPDYGPDILGLEFDSSGQLFAAALDGVYRWQASQSSWQLVGMRGQSVWALAAEPVAGAPLLITTQYSVWRGTPAAATIWLPAVSR
jgi:photosystem II stability/assembly factor-like uncharacterized protein